MADQLGLFDLPAPPAGAVARKIARQTRGRRDVDRRTRWGNMFLMAHEGTRGRAVAAFRCAAEGQVEAFPTYYEPLRGRNLGCWCPLDRACHADVLLEIANRPAAAEMPRRE